MVQKKKQQRPVNKTELLTNRDTPDSSINDQTPNKGNLMMSWVKRKLTPEKEADTDQIAKLSRNDK